MAILSKDDLSLMKKLLASALLSVIFVSSGVCSFSWAQEDVSASVVPDAENVSVAVQATAPDAEITVVPSVNSVENMPSENSTVEESDSLIDSAASSQSLPAGADVESVTVPSVKPVVESEVIESAMIDPNNTSVPVIHKADSVFMSFSTLLVILMTVPGLALFYGGLVRSKNMLSVLMQVFSVFSLITLIWVVIGYSLAFTTGSAFIGGLSKVFLSGIKADSIAATFSKGVYIPEYLFVMFQSTFAGITACLFVGAFAERAKFSAVLAFAVLWSLFSYLPIAHMVWYWDGPDAITGPDALQTVLDNAGYLWAKGALDFAGGTVVHVNAGIAGLIGAIMIGRRLGFGREKMAPHSLVMTTIGAGLLWVGWFGFNAGSNLEASATAGLAFANTHIATASAAFSWLLIEWLMKGKPSMLGVASGVVAGLVAITPACGFVGPMGAIAIGAIASLCCLLMVDCIKKVFKIDDALDVFAVHGIGGTVGSILTGVFAAPVLGGTGIWDYVANQVSADYSIVGQVWIQLQAVLITVVWSGLVSIVAFKLVDLTIGLRVSEEEERVGLDISLHDESAYNS